MGFEGHIGASLIAIGGGGGGHDNMPSGHMVGGGHIGASLIGGGGGG